MSLQPKVNDRSWHYHFWRGSYRILWLTPPERFSICPYFWRVVLFGPFCLYPLGLVLRICAPVVKLVFFLWTLLWKLVPEKVDHGPWVNRPSFGKRHPKLAKTGQVVGLVILSILGVSLVTVAVATFMVKPMILARLVMIIAIYATMYGIGYGIAAAVRSDTAGLVKDFLKARKERVCPFVEVVRS